MIIAPGFVGIDVSKHHLDVFDAACATPIRLANTAGAVAELAHGWVQRARDTVLAKHLPEIRNFASSVAKE